MGFINHHLAHHATLPLILESAGVVWNAYMLIKYELFKEAVENMKKDSKGPFIKGLFIKGISASVIISSVLAIATSSLVVEMISYVAQKVFSSPPHPSSMEWGNLRFYSGFIGAILGLSMHAINIAMQTNTIDESKQLIFSTALLSPFGVHGITQVVQKVLKE